MEEEKEKKVSKKKKILLIAIFIIFILIFSVIFSIINIGNEKVLGKVSIMGIDIGNMTREEAKETLNKTSFPLHNIHPHQIEHIRGVLFQKGIVFLIVRFVKLNRTYLLFGEDFVDYIDHHDRASIPLSYFEQRGHLILDQYHPRVDYLKVIDQIYGGANESELQKEL